MADFTRRGILSGSIAVAGMTAAGNKAIAAPAITKGLPDVAIVGAGVFGTWTALCLREAGASVTLLDAYGPGNARQTSGDETRQHRAAYGEDEIYTRWAMEALHLWTERQEEFKRGMVYKNGVLSPNEPEDKLAAEIRIFKKLGIPHEVLGPDELRARWPQARWDDVSQALYEPEAGTVKARESIIAASEVFQQKGGKLKIAKAAPGARAGGKMTDLDLGPAGRLSAGAYLFACGPWLPSVLPDILAGYISQRRSEVFYVGSPAGDARYSWRELPNMWETGTGAYAMSDIDYGYKVVPRLGTPIDPDTDERLASPYLVGRVHDYLERRIPGLAGQPIVASRVCVLESSDNHHYIIDTHPGLSNVWVAGAGSGHAFKMGPKLGTYVSSRMLGQPGTAEEIGLFAIANHGSVNG